jgi:hypothetical protein
MKAYPLMQLANQQAGTKIRTIMRAHRIRPLTYLWYVTVKRGCILIRFIRLDS